MLIQEVTLLDFSRLFKDIRLIAEPKYTQGSLLGGKPQSGPEGITENDLLALLSRLGTGRQASGVGNRVGRTLYEELVSNIA